MKAELKELILLAGIMILASLAVAGWTQHETLAPAVKAGEVPEQQCGTARSSTDNPNAAIRALSDGSAGFVK